MPLENSEHQTGRQPSGQGAARVSQSSGRVPWIRLAGGVVTALAVIGLAGWLPVASAAPAPATPEQQVNAHLNAGEFGAALQLATQIPDAGLQVLLIEKVAEAQLKSGDKSAVEATANLLPEGAARDRLQEAARGRTAGGANLANPGPLMMMIQQLTGGPPDSPWMETDGEGGAISWEQNGVLVDANGVLARNLTADQQGRLAALGLKSRAASLNKDMAAPSAMPRTSCHSRFVPKYVYS